VHGADDGFKRALFGIVDEGSGHPQSEFILRVLAEFFLIGFLDLRIIGGLGEAKREKGVSHISISFSIRIQDGGTARPARLHTHPAPWDERRLQ
jgi:hypothetical protein